MTLNEMTSEISDLVPGFRGDYAEQFDMNFYQASRIADVAESADEFIWIWENEEWWIDQ